MYGAAVVCVTRGTHHIFPNSQNKEINSMIYFISKVSRSASIRLLPSDYRFSLWTDCRLDSVSSPSVRTAIVIASCSMNVESRDLEITGPTLLDGLTNIMLIM